MLLELPSTMMATKTSMIMIIGTIHHIFSFQRKATSSRSVDTMLPIRPQSFGKTATFDLRSSVSRMEPIARGSVIHKKGGIGGRRTASWVIA